MCPYIHMAPYDTVLKFFETSSSKMLLSTLIIPCLALTLIICVTSSANEVQVDIDGTSTSATVPEGVVDDNLSAADLNEDDWDHGDDLGLTQDYDVDHVHEIQAKLQEARSYMETQIYPKYDVLRDKCRNKHESCAYWAVMGECDNNAAYMNETCAPVCLACESMLMELRCPVDPDAVGVWQPGDLNRMFERIATHPDFAKYEPRVLSRPSLLHGNSSNEESSYQVGPWLITLDNVLSQAAAERLLALGDAAGYKRSKPINEVFRGSSGSWCQQNDCLNDPSSQALIQAVENLTNIPQVHYEHFHFIQYRPNETFDSHHDYIPHQRKFSEGVRLLTVLIYLNNVEEGGGTFFPRLNVTIFPARGSAVIWPLVLNEDPNTDDPRTEDQPLAVLRGVKIVGKFYIHQHEFQTYFSRRCTFVLGETVILES